VSKFNTKGARTASGASPVKTAEVSDTRTALGGVGFSRQEQSELFLLGGSYMVGEDAFHEAASNRDQRFRELIGSVSLADPVWVSRNLVWLRTDGNVREAPLVGAAEMVRTYTSPLSEPANDPIDPDPRGILRKTVDRVLRRADQPGEILAYWTSRYGKAIPKPLKRGVADACRRLYNEWSMLKYDTASHAFRFGRVIELCHVEADPSKPWQNDLFKHMVDRRHGRGNDSALRVSRANKELRQEAESNPSVLLNTSRLRDAGMTWEGALSLAGSRVPKDKIWEAMIPLMGYEAQLKNLRNFDQTGVSDQMAQEVMTRLTDPDEVKRSGQFPMRFLAAYRAAPSLRWAYPLEQAMTLSLKNIARLPGRTLILVDTSESMNAGLSVQSEMQRWDAAALFGIALGLVCERADVVSYSADQWHMDKHYELSKVFPLRERESLLKAVERWKSNGYFIGAGTQTYEAVRKHFRPGYHDRIVLLTDEQHQGHVAVFQDIPQTVPTYTWNLAGYKAGHSGGGTNRHTFGGLTDAAFKYIPLLEAGRNMPWPWEVGGWSTPPAETERRPRRVSVDPGKTTGIDVR
jgi:hypothetical protein